MPEEYDTITALHYAAYRPSLHAILLKSLFASNEKFEIGLDVGCGTGYSCIALANYCTNVVGVDPSKEMLDKSIDHHKVTYQLNESNTLNFDANTFDIITFAGSLYYSKSQTILNEIVRVAKKNCRIIIYDFEIFLDPIFEQLGNIRDIQHSTDYNHQANFSGLDEQFIILNDDLINSVSLDIKITDLTHLLLSSKDNYARLADAFGATNLYEKTTKQLKSVFKNKITTLKAMTYVTYYQVNK